MNTKIIIKIICSIIVCLTFLNSCNSFKTLPQPQKMITPVPTITEKAFLASVKPIPDKTQLLLTQDPAIQKAFRLYQNSGTAPIISAKDFLQFPFGKNEPLVYCQPLHSCDIALEPGEQINCIFLGDTARWIYTQATSGTAGTVQPHVIIKPRDYDIATNLIITTTRRTYHIGVVSKQNSYVKEVTFWYPDDIQTKLSQQNQTELAQLPNINLTNLNFNYQIDSSIYTSAWKPLRVFNDGIHVYIQMPSCISTTDSPVLFVQNNDGQQALVNYRVRGNYYIVDQLFQQAYLISGIGSHQQRITITQGSV